MKDFRDHVVRGKILDIWRDSECAEFLGQLAFFRHPDVCQIFCVNRGHEIIPKGKFHDRRSDHEETQKEESSLPISF